MSAVGFVVLFWLAAGLLFYHLAGYPLLLGLLARLARRPIRRGAITPRVSIIIAAHNEGGVIAAKLRSVQESDYPRERMEIIVVEDGSTDDTVAQVLGVLDARTVLDHSPDRGGKMAAIRRALARAHGEILVFSDANALWRRDTLCNLVGNFADPAVGSASGRKRLSGTGTGMASADSPDLAANENLYWRYEAWIKRMESAIGSTPAAVGELLAVRRELCQVPAVSVINDDFQIVVQVVGQGYRAVYDDTAVTIEAGSGTMGDEFGRKSRIAAGRGQVFGQVLRLAPRHPGFVAAFLSHKGLRLVVMPLLVLAFVGSLGALLFPSTAWLDDAGLIGLRPPWGAIALGGQVILYALAGLGAVLDRTGRRFKPAAVAYYLLSAQLASFAGLVRLVAGRQTVLWRKVAR